MSEENAIDWLATVNELPLLERLESIETMNAGAAGLVTREDGRWLAHIVRKLIEQRIAERGEGATLRQRVRDLEQGQTVMPGILPAGSEAPEPPARALAGFCPSTFKTTQP